MKKISVRPTRHLSLEFEDGVKKDLKFNSYTMMLLDEEFEDGCLVILVKAIKKPYQEGSKIVYAGLKTCDEKVTFEEAKGIVTLKTIQYLQPKILGILSN